MHIIVSLASIFHSAILFLPCFQTEFGLSLFFILQNFHSIIYLYSAFERLGLRACEKLLSFGGQVVRI
jgi:hypothetical protein